MDGVLGRPEEPKESDRAIPYAECLPGETSQAVPQGNSCGDPRALGFPDCPVPDEQSPQPQSPPENKKPGEVSKGVPVNAGVEGQSKGQSPANLVGFNPQQLDGALKGVYDRILNQEVANVKDGLRIGEIRDSEVDHSMSAIIDFLASVSKSGESMRPGIKGGNNVPVDAANNNKQTEKMQKFEALGGRTDIPYEKAVQQLAAERVSQILGLGKEANKETWAEKLTEYERREEIREARLSKRQMGRAGDAANELWVKDNVERLMQELHKDSQTFLDKLPKLMGEKSGDEKLTSLLLRELARDDATDFTRAIGKYCIEKFDKWDENHDGRLTKDEIQKLIDKKSTPEDKLLDKPVLNYVAYSIFLGAKPEFERNGITKKDFQKYSVVGY